jgi:hypothetical protein
LFLEPGHPVHESSDARDAPERAMGHEKQLQRWEWKFDLEFDEVEEFPFEPGHDSRADLRPDRIELSAQILNEHPRRCADDLFDYPSIGRFVPCRRHPVKLFWRGGPDF